jgi:hypothetical protein
MSNKVFHEARLKIQRAVEHINDLNVILGEFSKRQTHEVVIEHDPNGGDDLLKVRATETLPDSFTLTLGDALHNLRTSLDYAIAEIEFTTTGSRSDYTRFPVDQSRDALKARVEGGLAKRTSKQVIDCIVESVQPYTGGNGDFICSLNDLDIEDKHRLLIAKTEFKYVDGIILINDQGKEIRIATWQVRNNLIASHPLNGVRNSKVKNHGKASFEVLFGDTLPFAGYTIVPAMRNLTKAVAGTVNEIEHSFRLSQM